MKNAWKIFWGLGFVLIAVVLILDALGVLAGIISPLGEVSIIAMIGGLLLLACVFERIIKGKICEIFIPLSLIFIIFEKNIAHVLGFESNDIINNWLLFGCACLMQLGFTILFSGIRRGKRRNRGDRVFENSGSLGSSVKYINCDGFKYEEIENNLGSYTVYFDNVDKYEGGGVLKIDNNLGSMTINVPSGWHIKMDVENTLGGTSIPSENNYDGPILTIKGYNNLGSVSVKYV